MCPFPHLLTRSEQHLLLAPLTTCGPQREHDSPLPRPLSPVRDTRRATARWLADGGAQGWRSQAQQNREHMLHNLAWWMEHEEGLEADLDSLSPAALRSFLAYLQEPCPEGRWGSNHHAVKRATRPSTEQTYHRHLRAFANFCIAEGLLDERPLSNVKTPKVPNDQVQPFSPEQVQVPGGRRPPERRRALGRADRPALGGLRPVTEQATYYRASVGCDSKVRQRRAVGGGSMPAGPAAGWRARPPAPPRTPAFRGSRAPVFPGLRHRLF